MAAVEIEATTVEAALGEEATTVVAAEQVKTTKK